jgi:hypothetical protein
VRRTAAVGALLVIATILCARDTFLTGYPGRWLVPADVAAAGSTPVPHDGAPAWDGGVNCARGFTVGAEELGRQLQTTFTQITRVFGYECRPNTALPNETSQHGTGRAIDLAIPVRDGDADNELGDPVANWLVMNSSRIGVQLIIWDHTIWVGRLTGTKDLPYTGPDPHIDHIHVELNQAGAEQLTEFFRKP